MEKSLGVYTKAAEVVARSSNVAAFRAVFTKAVEVKVYNYDQLCSSFPHPLPFLTGCALHAQSHGAKGLQTGNCQGDNQSINQSINRPTNQAIIQSIIFQCRQQAITKSLLPPYQKFPALHLPVWMSTCLLKRGSAYASLVLGVDKGYVSHPAVSLASCMPCTNSVPNQSSEDPEC